MRAAEHVDSPVPGEMTDGVNKSLAQACSDALWPAGKPPLSDAASTAGAPTGNGAVEMSDAFHALGALGWDDGFAANLSPFAADLASGRLTVGRVSLARREYYRVLTARGALEARLGGRMRHRAAGPLDMPTVGDWVLVSSAPTGDNRVAVVAMLPRRTQLVRKTAGKRTELQLLGANVNTVAVVTSPDHDYNPRRLQRYLAAIEASGARALVVLNKQDLCSDPDARREQLIKLCPGAAVLLCSATVQTGMDGWLMHLKSGETLMLVGSSGVGKSTLANRFLGRAAQRVGTVSERSGRGCHVTTSRELFLLPSGAMLIDTPGLRELHVWEVKQDDFADIQILSEHCRFRNCTHRTEPDCHVQQAVREGTLAPERLESFHKLCDEAKQQRPWGS